MPKNCSWPWCSVGWHNKVGGKNSTFVGSALWLPLNKKVVRGTLKNYWISLPRLLLTTSTIDIFWDRGIPCLKINLHLPLLLERGPTQDTDVSPVSQCIFYNLNWLKLMDVLRPISHWKNHRISKKTQSSFLMGWTNAWKKKIKKCSKCVPKNHFGSINISCSPPTVRKCPVRIREVKSFKTKKNLLLSIILVVW